MKEFREFLVDMDYFEIYYFLNFDIFFILVKINNLFILFF